MTLLAMPFLVINYGSEMIYILEQRLHSQQIKQEKAHKVLHDLTRALFNEPMITELLRPQPLYTFQQMRDLCDKLAQSSIMKLSTDSMDKLFDLVVMGVKYQTLSVRHPCELIDVTLNHVDYIANLVSHSATSSETIAKARDAFVRFSKELSVAEYAQIRMALLGLALHRRVKVSLFLQEKMQHSDGRFVIPPGGPLANEDLVEAPGVITYEGGAEERFDYPLAQQLRPKLTGDPYDPVRRDSVLGQNMYTIDRKAEQQKQQQAAAATPAAAPVHGRGGSTKAAAMHPPAQHGRPQSAGAAELDHLGRLLGVRGRPATAQSFKINLFDRPADDAGGGGPGRAEEICIPRMTREELEKHNRELVEVMSGLDIAQGETSAADLADLFDQVAGH
eukprot:TRINITY_DN20416_c0_g1_i1.p2 TRINITY_DN20416_c0_g1~~TRINITY_DN20416_c0_g1_i1.p2  ORF type:complete len:426 (+),score=147.13 TRINITY_DN20416_c0_g1_i1:108-1280(+)